MTHGHELRGKECWWEEGAGLSGTKGREKWDKCNSIINKIYKNTPRVFSTISHKQNL